MLEVRAARHGDAPALDALGAAPEAGVFVLEKNGAVIGALTLRAGEIFGCAVAPEWRGRGYGTFLLRRALRAAGPGPVCSQTPPGNAAMEGVCCELGVPFARCGSLVVARSGEEAELEALSERGRENGVEGLEIVGRDRLLQLEPHIAQEITAALYAPTGGIVCPVFCK